MLVSKIFEIRGPNTFIPVLVTQLRPSAPATGIAERSRDEELLGRSGFGINGPKYLYVRLQGLRVSYDSQGDYFLESAIRTIENNFDRMPSGSIVEVKYMGEDWEAVPPS